MSEVNFPKEWVLTKIIDIADVNPKKLDAEPETLSGFIPMTHAPTNFNGILCFDEKPWGEIKKSYTNFKDDDVIVAKVTPCFENGKAAIVRGLPNGIGAGSSEFYVLRPAIKEVSTRFLFSIVKSHKFLQEGAANMTGAVGLRRVPRAFIEAFPVGLPPLAEQKIIADKLDTLLAQVETTKARLDRIPQILKTFRQSVLAATVSGKLTEEWRDNQNINIESWVDGTLGDFVEKPTYGSSSKSKPEGTVPVLRMGNLQDGKLDWTNLVYTSDPVEIDKYKLLPGDVLFNRTNSPELVGKTSIYRGEREAIYAGYLIRILCKKNLNAEYLNYLLNSPDAKDYCYRVKSDGVSQSNINAQKLKAFPLSIPTSTEQIEIVRRVEQLFAHADKIEQQVQAAQQRVNNLTQSILAKAFCGELTADWRAANSELISGDNSAEVLLAKIKSKREALANKKMPKKKTAARRKV